MPPKLGPPLAEVGVAAFDATENGLTGVDGTDPPPPIDAALLVRSGVLGEAKIGEPFRGKLEIEAERFVNSGFGFDSE